VGHDVELFIQWSREYRISLLCQVTVSPGSFFPVKTHIFPWEGKKYLSSRKKHHPGKSKVRQRQQATAFHTATCNYFISVLQYK